MEWTGNKHLGFAAKLLVLSGWCFETCFGSEFQCSIKINATEMSSFFFLLKLHLLIHTVSLGLD